MKIGDGSVIDIALPAEGSGLILGSPVQFVVSNSPVVVSGTVGCTPAPGVVCEKADWVEVTVISANDPNNPDAGPKQNIGRVVDTSTSFP